MSQPALTTRVKIREFRANLSLYLKQVEAGSHIAVVSRDKIVAELHPPSAPEPPASGFGCMHGQIGFAQDWDAPDNGLIDIMLNNPVFPGDAA
jgi:antitoxin (DNA-binding transcriptional repressor) of toxin-antitoxin stability system